MIEDRIRSLLVRRASAFEISDRIPQAVLRKTRIRRLLTAAIALSSFALLMVGGFVVAGTYGDGDESPPPVGTTPSDSKTSAEPPSDTPRGTVFIPPTREQDGTVTMPLTFPDGSRTELEYPRELRLAEMGVTGGDIAFSSFGERGAEGGCIWEIHISYGDPHGSYYKGEESLQEYQGTLVPVELWRGVDGSPFSLVFRLESWTAVMLCDEAPSKNAEETWIRKLASKETPDGFVILQPHSPVELAGPGERGGPSLNIGDQTSRVAIVPGTCKVGSDARPIAHKQVELFPGGALWCSEEAQMTITAYGNDEFIDKIVQGLKVKNTLLAR